MLDSSVPGNGRKDGHGLGLTIAMGQARVLGAALRFSNAPEGGAVAAYGGGGAAQAALATARSAGTSTRMPGPIVLAMVRPRM